MGSEVRRPGFSSLLPSLQDVGRAASSSTGNFTGINSLNADNHPVTWVHSHPDLKMRRPTQRGALPGSGKSGF